LLISIEKAIKKVYKKVVLKADGMFHEIDESEEE